MFQRAIQVSFFAVLVSLAGGCAPDGAEVCKHSMKVMENDPDKPAWLEDEDKCYERMENTKNRHGVNSYRREVECMLAATTAYKIRTCLDVEGRRRE